MPENQSDNTEQRLASHRAILKSLTPQELEVEYTRVVQLPPAEDLAQGDMIAIMLEELRRQLASNT